MGKGLKSSRKAVAPLKEKTRGRTRIGLCTKSLPPSIHDELKHLGKAYIPDENKMVAGITGSGVMPVIDVLCSRMSPFDVTSAVIFFAEDDIIEKIDNGGISEDIEDITDVFICGVGAGVLIDDIQAHIIRPGIFASPGINLNSVNFMPKENNDAFEIPKISFHGTAPIGIGGTVKKTKIHRKSDNAKKKPGDYKARFRASIRTAHFDNAVAQVERQRFYQDVSQAERQSSNVMEA